MNPVQQSEVTAKNGNKGAASKYEVRYDILSDIGHFPREKNNWSEKIFVDILAVCNEEQFSEDHSEELNTPSIL